MCFSTFGLKSVYLHLRINESDKPFTVFEENGRLYQFTRVPFGVTNGVAVFHQAIEKFAEEENLCDTFPYLDSITIGGRDQKEHDIFVNFKKFLAATEKKTDVQYIHVCNISHINQPPGLSAWKWSNQTRS